MIVTALALTMGACTIHRHYHQAPATGPQANASSYSTAPVAPDDQTPDYGDDEPGDQPIAPSYARPDYRAAPAAPTYDNYRYERRYDSRYEHRCDCDRVRPRRRHGAVRRAPGYRIHPGPVVPDNPVEWLE